MPKKSKITAVPINQPVEAHAEQEPKTEAQDMTDVMNEIKTSEPETLVEPVAEPVAEPEQSPKPSPKPRAKRTPKAKAQPQPARGTSGEPEVVVTDVTPDAKGTSPKGVLWTGETVVEVTVPEELNKEQKGVDKVSCPDCGKQMSAKTLKYSHGPNCLVKKKENNEAKTERVQPSVTDEMIEHEIEKRMNNKRVERITKRQKDLEQLAAKGLPS